MGYFTDFQGEIRIEPPIPHAQIADSPWEPDRAKDANEDLTFRVEGHVVSDVEHGPRTELVAVAIHSTWEDEARGYHVVECLQRIVDAYPDHRFVGRIDCEGEEAGDIWRLAVVNGVATKIRPRVVWPEDETPGLLLPAPPCEVEAASDSGAAGIVLLDIDGTIALMKKGESGDQRNLITTTKQSGIREGWYSAECECGWGTSGAEGIVEEDCQMHIDNQHSVSTEESGKTHVAEEPETPNWDIRRGDQVLLLAEVRRHEPGVGVLVDLFSKTDQYQAWVREDHIVGVQPLGDGCPSEPPDGTMLLGDQCDGEGSVFRRDDKDGHCDQPERRFDRHWWDYAGSQWIDWPTAVRRGANPGRMLVEAGSG